MKRFIEYYLEETITTSATNTEQAICYYHNLENMNTSEETALELAGLTPQNKKTVLNKSAVNTSNKGPLMKSLGSQVRMNLKQSGRAAGTVSSKWRGRNNTPKTDIYEISGNKSRRKFSVKTGEARLLGAKKDEAMATFDGAYAHYNHNEKIVVPSSVKSQITKNLSGMITDMSDVEFDISKLKKIFKEWYLSESGRSSELNGKSNDVDRHMKHELFYYKLAAGSFNMGSLLGGNDKFLIDKKKIEQYMKKFYESETLIRYVGKDKEQIKEATRAVQNAFDTNVWQESLRNILSQDRRLSKWIVYEAASGMYKFTGNPWKSNSLNVPDAVATHFLKISGNSVSIETVYGWSTKNSNLVKNISINFKGGGDSKWNILSLSAQEQYEQYIAEGFLDYVKKKTGEAMNSIRKVYDDVVGFFSELYEKFKGVVQSFYENYIQKTLNYVVDLLDRGIDAFLSFLGYEIEGSFS